MLSDRERQQISGWVRDAKVASVEIKTELGVIPPFRPRGRPPKGESIGVMEMPSGSWRAQLVLSKNKTICVGFFGTEDEARRAWDRKAIEVRGINNTRLNFPGEHGVTR